ncbi:MAG: ATP-binding protein [Gemmatimonadetes bacterium]|nr:ATP-binding protein [Gemmatimonadota bacterium]
MRAARLPVIQDGSPTSTTFQPSVKREQLSSPLRSFLERKEHVVFLRPPGVGKTHLALSLPCAPPSTADGSITTLADLLHALEDAQAAGAYRSACGRSSSQPDGDRRDRLPAHHPHRGDALLPTPRAALRGASTILTSNKGFEDWGEIFGDEVGRGAHRPARAPLSHRQHPGNSYRLRQHAELARRLHVPPPPPPLLTPRATRTSPRSHG